MEWLSRQNHRPSGHGADLILTGLSGQDRPEPYRVIGQVRPDPYRVIGHVRPDPYRLIGQVRPDPYRVIGHVRPDPYRLIGQVRPDPYRVIGHVRPDPYRVIGQVRPDPYRSSGQVRLWVVLKPSYSQPRVGSDIIYPSLPNRPLITSEISPPCATSLSKRSPPIDVMLAVRDGAAAGYLCASLQLIGQILSQTSSDLFDGGTLPTFVQTSG